MRSFHDNFISMYLSVMLLPRNCLLKFFLPNNSEKFYATGLQTIELDEI